ncbi:AGE family epimerase/isomerase [Komagataeibacter intermedius]|uniref:Mannose-6-phosphate isomerase n=2 Tax=Komagataeibacter intermedius TaxID=66229 RepID=A0A0N0MGJ0_9PROT|nr:AGE family epimerase/isomerase [Komagataeibacter intermedius]KPH88823.1 mannose-6-phosphate isomerase [Komagataeibacter intermedius AF2]MCF3635302.1 AGE family epimerase/isomerase [Komagataeibacter intermedius]GAN87507.1 mannose-6-phosphate isomerase [Komagataeibacter intermedius TF2]GBQ67704.1 mannose-6-phosphate isomerase [Komagataeibacter intermedius NRIC 0521]
MTPARFQSWAVRQALPLWSENGFDSQRALFHERLDFNARPLPLPALRLMVQARQIATYCRAALRGDCPAGDMALRCLAEVERRYHRADGAAGWVFSLAPDGRPADRRRDLYTHAFILFAYAWAYRLSGDPGLKRHAAGTATELETIFHTSGPGFMDAVPPHDAIRRQNPHMHLLEAWLALYDATGEENYRARAARLVTLATTRFIDPDSGLLLEDFSADWQPLHPAGRNRAEPGHLLEWSWLLHEYLRLCAPGDAATIRQVAGRLHLTALAHTTGIMPLVIRNAVTQDGRVVDGGTRIWPQTELIRSLGANQSAPVSSGIMPGILAHFATHYIPSHLNGGWIDRLNADGTTPMDHMPASSLYHIYGAVCDLTEGHGHRDAAENLSHSAP